ncbi:MFS transporter [Siminovitchia fortis]|uniref:MFS transporter n=1 Tax=Siminovitchia fortis TaxID=254758 RepID=A0A443IQH4_9BACI|nr:MFS transporter [Siminovitchia fortis]RWR08626.1 MFS transporter [Siminovitchia fortis]WHY83130.1 MFS transporter [Siminovitchia fortis]
MKSKSFRFLWIGQLFANLGDVFYVVGLISILYTVTESVMYLALLPFLNTFGRFISSFISPLLLNRYRLKLLLINSQLSKTTILLILAFWVSFQSSLGIWFIVCCILLIAFFDGWAMPATDALIPRLVKESELLKANSFMSVINETVQLGGWAMGGILVALINGQNVIWLTFVLFVLSTVMMIRIVDDTPFQVKDEKQKTFETLKEGWFIIWKNPTFRSIHVMIFMEAMANVVWVAAILYVFVNEVLNVTEAWWGYINTAFFLGLILGGVICSRFSLKIEKIMRKTVLFSSFGVSIITFLFGLNSIAWVALILVAFSGFIDQIKGITIRTYLQKEAAAEDLPKIYSAQYSMVTLVFGFSTLAFGGIAEFSVQLAFLISGLLLTGSAIYMLIVKKRFPDNYTLE